MLCVTGLELRHRDRNAGIQTSPRGKDIVANVYAVGHTTARALPRSGGNVVRVKGDKAAGHGTCSSTT